MMQMPTQAQGVMSCNQPALSCYQHAAALESVSEGPSYTQMELPSGCPSVASALHGTGRCQPCAWFWKLDRGCKDGAQCDHCHLCPEGELKARKKAKINALR